MNKPIMNCLLCERDLQGGMGWKELLTAVLPKTICPRCEQRFERVTQQAHEGVITLFHYNEAMKDFLHRYKFMYDVVLAHGFNREISAHLKRESRLIIPIPMHPESLKQRTFSHVDEWLKAANIPFAHHLTKQSSEQQSKKTRRERLATAQLFEVTDPAAIKDKNIVLVDDIYTTGTTFRHAKKALLEGGANTVEGFILIHS